MASKEIMGIDSNILRELKKIFKETDIQEVELEESDLFYLKVSRKKGGSKAAANPTYIPIPYQSGGRMPMGGGYHEMGAEPAPAVEAAVAAPAAGGSEYDDETKYHKIVSPVIGTFYSAPSPDAKNFVNSGDFVSPDSTVCIVEAMKVMNEIKADAKGKIVQILKSNADSVQAGETLFIVEKV